MKKLFFAGALALASLQSCQNSTDEFVSTPVGKEKVTAKTSSREFQKWDKPSENPYELDGYIHVFPEKVVYMGNEVAPLDVESPIHKDLLDYLTNGNSTDRVVRSTVCTVRGDMGSTISLVSVCNSGNCNSYYVIHYPSGNTFTYANDGFWNNDALTCAALYLQSL